MKILICSFTYYPSVNGVQNVTEYQAEGLVARGHEVTVLTGYPKGRNCQPEEFYNGVHIQRFHASTDNMLHCGNKKAYQKLLLKLSSQMDVIMTVCPETWCTDWAIPLVGKLNCTLVMMTHGIHDLRWRNFRDRSTYGILRKLWGNLRWPPFFAMNWSKIQNFDAIIQLHENDFATWYFQKHGIEKQYVLYNAVEDAFFVDDVAKEKQIINVGTYCTNKNQEKALEAFYKANLPEYKLVLIGSKRNKYYDLLQARAKELERIYGHRDVEIDVGITRDETVKKVKQSQIYLLTSISEMFPVSLIEGMAASCAWVSTDVGIDRYLPGGVIADKADDIAAALEQLTLGNTWQQKGVISRNFALENCRRGKQIEQLEKIMYEAVKRKAM